MLPLGSISTPMALLQVVTPGGKLAQCSTSLYDEPFSSAARTPAGFALMNATRRESTAARITLRILRPSPVANRPSSLLVELHFLSAPVPDLADDQIVLGPTVDGVDHAEFLGQLACLAELADDLSAQLELVDLAVVHAFRIVRVGAVEILRRSARHADRLRRADIGDLRLERAFAVEDLDAVVAGVGHVDVACRIAGDAADLVELPLSRSGLAPRLHEVPFLGELRDAVVGAEAVGDVDVAGAIPRHVRRAVEAVAVDAGSRRAAAASA